MSEAKDFRDLINKQRKVGDEQFQADSKERLKKISQTKIKTTMIGALSAFEKGFGFLMGLDEDGNSTGKSLSPEEQHMRDVYEQVRNEVLDLGNNQIRNLFTELELYDVKWNRYHMTLPVMPQGPEENNE
jgi:hypothetical protein